LWATGQEEDDYTVSGEHIEGLVSTELRPRTHQSDQDERKMRGLYTDMPGEIRSVPASFFHAYRPAMIIPGGISQRSGGYDNRTLGNPVPHQSNQDHSAAKLQH